MDYKKFGNINNLKVGQNLKLVIDYLNSPSFRNQLQVENIKTFLFVLVIILIVYYIFVNYILSLVVELAFILLLMVFTYYIIVSYSQNLVSRIQYTLNSLATIELSKIRLDDKYKKNKWD